MATKRPVRKAAGKPGKLTKKQFGPSMPVTGPAVQEPPFWYRNMEMMFVTYRTDEAAAQRILPEGLELAGPATATCIIAHYHWSTFGPYHEAILGIACTWKGTPMTYLPYLFVNQEAPLIAGREIWGYAKKLATLNLVKEHELYMGTIERPTGNRLATAVMRTCDNLKADAFKMDPIISLKVIPNCAGGAPAIAELVACDFDVRPVVATDGVAELWTGPGNLTWNTPSACDPWCELAVKETVSCVYGFFNGYLPYGRVLRTY